jgi:hypothetical protein
MKRSDIEILSGLQRLPHIRPNRLNERYETLPDGVSSYLSTDLLRLVHLKNGADPTPVVDKIYKPEEGLLSFHNANEIRFYDQLRQHLDGCATIYVPRAIAVLTEQGKLGLRTEYVEGSRRPTDAQALNLVARALAELANALHGHAQSLKWLPRSRFNVDDANLNVGRDFVALYEFLDLPELAKVAQEFTASPDRALEAFNAAPRGIIHGDANLTNMRILPDDRLLVVDWVRIAYGPLACDVMRFLGCIWLVHMTGGTAESYRELEGSVIDTFLDGLSLSQADHDLTKASMDAIMIHSAATLAPRARQLTGRERDRGISGRYENQAISWYTEIGAKMENALARKG